MKVNVTGDAIDIKSYTALYILYKEEWLLVREVTDVASDHAVCYIR